MKNPKDCIQKKSKGKFSKGQPGGSKKIKVEKLCQNCGKWNPNSMHTHNTVDCRKWSAVHGTYKSNNDHAMDGDMKVCFAQMRKDL